MTAAVRFHCQRPDLPAPARPTAAASLVASVAEPYGNEIAEFPRAGRTLLVCTVERADGVHRNEEHLLIIKDEKFVTTYLEGFEHLWLAGRDVVANRTRRRAEKCSTDAHAAGGFC